MCSLLAQQWYQCTSDVQERRSYLLLTNETVYVPVHSIVQETTLQFDRAGLHNRILSEEAHLKIMRHNFSNVIT